MRRLKYALISFCLFCVKYKASEAMITVKPYIRSIMYFWLKIRREVYRIQCCMLINMHTFSIFSFFGKAFEQAASSTSSRTLHDNFDTFSKLKQHLLLCFSEQVVLFEPEHDKTHNLTCAPSEVSDQPGHPPSLISIFTMCFMGS